MHIDLSGSVGRYVYGFIIDHVPNDERTGSRRDAVDVYPGRTGGRRILGIRTVAGNKVTSDDVVDELLARSMAVHGNARQAVVFHFIVNHHVIIGLCAGHGIENADSRPDSRGLSTIVR